MSVLPMPVRDAITETIKETPMDLEGVPGAVIREIVERTLRELPGVIGYEKTAWVRRLTDPGWIECAECEGLITPPLHGRNVYGRPVCFECETISSIKAEG